MFRNLVVLIALITPYLAGAQCWMEQNFETITQYIYTDSTEVTFNIVKDFDREPGYKDKIQYYWFDNKNIQATYGGTGGKILHGLYLEYFKDKTLKSRGAFKFGRKKGKWKLWFSNGNIKKTERFWRGRVCGWSLEYNEKGQLQIKTRYWKGKKNGKRIYFNNGVEDRVEVYRKDILKEELEEETLQREEKQPFFKRMALKFKKNQDQEKENNEPKSSDKEEK